MIQFKKKASIIGNLMKYSKLGDRKLFFELAEKSGIFNNLQSLSSVEASKLIYSFSNLRIQDRHIWQILENLFLYNEKNMNMHDFIMCTWAFQRYSRNPAIWSKIEDAINLNYLTWKQDQIKNPNLGLAVYSFAMQNHGSDKLWQKFLLISKETLPYLDERNIVLTGYSFCKKRIRDEGFWRIFEKTLMTCYQDFKFVNQITVLYSLSMMKKGSKELWDMLEKPFIQKDIKQVKSRDIVQILFSYGKVDKGSPKLWSHMENMVFENWDSLSFADINQISYSFYISDKGDQVFWDKFFSQPIKGEYVRGFKPENSFNEIVFFARIYKKKTKVQEQLWDHLTKQFSKFLNIPGVLLKSSVPISYQTQFFKHHPEIFTENVEKMYVKKIEHFFKVGGPMLITQVINVSYFLNDIQLASESTWNRLIDLIIQNKQMLLNQHPKDLSGFSQCIYIFCNLHPYVTDEILNKLDSFCCQDDVYELFTLKCMAINLRVFQRHLNHNKFIKKRIKEILNKQFITNDQIFSMILTLVNRNNYLFSQMESGEFNRLFEDIMSSKLNNRESRAEFMLDIRGLLFDEKQGGKARLLGDNLPGELEKIWEKYLGLENLNVKKYLINRDDLDEPDFMYGENILERQSEDAKEFSRYFEKQQEDQKSKEF